MRYGSWLAQRVPNERARVRLFCYPHAGGGASAFSGWRRRVPETVELCPFEPPGRWTRHRDPLLHDVESLVAGLLPELSENLSLPYVLLGHSVGGFVMFEAARQIERRGLPAPSHLVLAARGAPQLRRGRIELHALPDDELLSRLRDLYGARRLGALADPEVRALFLPALRADLEALETYRCADEAALTIPLSAYGGGSDPSVREPELEAWGAQTQGPFRHALVPGDHFFIHDLDSPFFDHLGAILEAVADPR